MGYVESPGKSYTHFLFPEEIHILIVMTVGSFDSTVHHITVEYQSFQNHEPFVHGSGKTNIG